MRLHKHLEIRHDSVEKQTNKRKNVLGGSEIQPSCACLQHASQNARILRCVHTQR